MLVFEELRGLLYVPGIYECHTGRREVNDIEDSTNPVFRRQKPTLPIHS